MKQQVIYTNAVETTIDKLIERFSPSSTFILVDSNTQNRVLPRLISLCNSLQDCHVITISSGDESKDLDTVTKIWSELSNSGATRDSLLINLGGGMVTDIGAFAASTFKRGIKFINIPTTLLSAVDAAIGGKTGFNFNGLKNEIGTFKEADAVIITTEFFGTLPPQEIKSGYAEMLKHALLTDDTMLEKLTKKDITEYDSNQLLELIEESNDVKKDIVDKDPNEKNIRKALNFGHTVGHAFEALALQRNSPIPHGYAVAYGMGVELILSTMLCGFPKTKLNKISRYIFDNYLSYPLNSKDYEIIIDIMRHDKKNCQQNKIAMTLLKNVGEVQINYIVSKQEIEAALDIYKSEFSKY